MNSTSAKSAPQTLQTVERALSFLEYVAAAEPAPTVQQVSVGLGLNITTCYHLMRTLLARGYLERRADATLQLGAGVGALFRTYQLNFNINDKLAGIVSELAGTTAETSFLSTLDDRNLILKILVEGSQPLRVTGLYIGLTGNEPHRAAGKAVLAHADTTLRDEIIARNLTGMTPTAQRRFHTSLLQELEEVRTRGWAVDIDSSPGITAIGSPFFEHDGSIAGAVGIVAPTSRFSEAQDKLVGTVLDAAHKATAVLGLAP
ncbi:DNA-binding transcriptional regulator, IclR family [Sinosporangium album]|uniref:DNA-binding transcriptional regulator, IclR family n=1 Tax=Sinosporangium album TaxID=504805 RepID=A0A1G7QS98_9ACTN|nr:IclR family transcriptional regulator [Sinosporangium album]SDG01385.1 DNA-binding transcriptional regulator, IclR family [Sinosporangium album]